MEETSFSGFYDLILIMFMFIVLKDLRGTKEIYLKVSQEKHWEKHTGSSLPQERIFRLMECAQSTVSPSASAVERMWLAQLAVLN